MRNRFCILILIIFSACIDRKNGQESDLQSRKVVEREVAKLSELGIWDVWGISQQNGCFLFKVENGIKVVSVLDFGKDANRQDILSRTANESKQSFIAYDFVKDELLEFKVEKNGDVSPRTLDLPEGEQHLAAMKGKDFIISTGLYEVGRYRYYSLTTGEIKYCLSYPWHPDFPDMTEKTKAILYASSVLRLRPDETAFVCGDMYSGNIEFCRIEGGNITRVKSLCLHLPEIKIKESESVIYRRSNRMGFSDIAVSQDQVYALHSGKTYLRNNTDFVTCDELLEFDWDGNLLSKYDLKTSVTSILYDEKEHALYAVKNKANIPLLKIELPD